MEKIGELLEFNHLEKIKELKMENKLMEVK